MQSNEQQQQARRSQPAKTSAGAKVVLVLILAFMAMLVLGSCLSDHPGAGSASATATARITCYGATSLDDVAPVLEAYVHSDVAALAGLLARGKAIELEQGTRVTVVGARDAGVTPVLIDSGFHAGQRCYVWDKFLAR